MRFQVGEIAILALVISHRYMQYRNQECEVIEVGPFPIGTPTQTGPTTFVADYHVQFADGLSILVRDWQLRKINPPEEPASMTHHEETTA